MDRRNVAAAIRYAHAQVTVTKTTAGDYTVQFPDVAPPFKLCEQKVVRHRDAVRFANGCRVRVALHWLGMPRNASQAFFEVQNIKGVEWKHLVRQHVKEHEVQKRKDAELKRQLLWR
jgi:hypothetical protein